MTAKQTWLRPAGATERGSAEMVKPTGLALKHGERVKGAGALRAASFTSEGGEARMAEAPSRL